MPLADPGFPSRGRKLHKNERNTTKRSSRSAIAMAYFIDLVKCLSQNYTRKLQEITMLGDLQSNEKEQYIPYLLQSELEQYSVLTTEWNGAVFHHPALHISEAPGTSGVVIWSPGINQGQFNYRPPTKRLSVHGGWISTSHASWEK